MGLISLVNSHRLHETENTRRITAGFLEKKIIIYGSVLLGFGVLEPLEPVHGQFGGPLYRLCQESVQRRRWIALPLTNHWLSRLGISLDAIRSAPHCYTIERVLGGLEVVSPNIEVPFLTYGAGSSKAFDRNYEKDPTFRAVVDAYSEALRRKRLGL